MPEERWTADHTVKPIYNTLPVFPEYLTHTSSLFSLQMDGQVTDKSGWQTRGVFSLSIECNLPPRQQPVTEGLTILAVNYQR